MTITLRPDQEAWLAAQVAKGDYASVEAAAQTLLDEKIAEVASMEADDFAWAKPWVDEGRAAIARGDFMSLEDYEARTRALLRSPQG